MIIINKKRVKCNSVLHFCNNRSAIFCDMRTNVKKDITMADNYCKIDKKHI